MDKFYWVSGIFVEGGRACANWLNSPCMSMKEAAHAIRVWVDGYDGKCASAFIKEEDRATGEKRVVFAGNFVNFVGYKDTEALDKLEKELKGGCQCTEEDRKRG